MPKPNFILKRIDYDNGTRLTIEIGNWRNQIEIPDNCPIDRIADEFRDFAETIRKSNA